MPNILEVDTLEEQNAEADAFEEEAWRVGPTEGAADLSNGGVVNGVRVRPARDKSVTRGRPSARRAWMWNGTETLLPLAWDPDGKVQDYGARYFRKRYCLCCHYGGFKGNQCPACVKDNCINCNGSSDRTKVIPCFYRRQEDVPFPTKVYGSIPCFLESCVRRDRLGFKTENDMRLHARSRHKLEYQAYIDSQAAAKTDEVTELRHRLDALMASMAQGQVQPPKKERTEAQKEAARRLGAASRARARLRAP